MAGDAVPQVLLFLEQAAQALQARGVQRSRIVLDPGIGFGKTVAQNCPAARGRTSAGGRLPAAGGLVAQVVHRRGRAGRCARAAARGAWPAAWRRR